MAAPEVGGRILGMPNIGCKGRLRTGQRTVRLAWVVFVVAAGPAGVARYVIDSTVADGAEASSHKGLHG